MSYKNKENPAEKSCWKPCPSCIRCEDKGLHDKCFSCSGRVDLQLRRDPYDFDDRCRCSEGILQLRTRKGDLIQTHYPHNPYGGRMKFTPESQDERDYDSWLQEERERRDDENFNPIEYEQ